MGGTGGNWTKKGKGSKKWPESSDLNEPFFYGIRFDRWAGNIAQQPIIFSNCNPSNFSKHLSATFWSHNNFIHWLKFAFLY